MPALGTTLYYPYIHPRSTKHLKAALMYWDQIRRIVPDSITHGPYVQGDDDDAHLLAQNGLLIATRPEPYEKRAIGRFFEYIEPRSPHFRIDIDTARSLAMRNKGIHISKMGYEALYRMEQLGLAHKHGEWVSMHDEVAAFYMFCLASEMAGSMSVPLFTDSPEDAAIGQALLFEPEGAPSSSISSETLLCLGIALPSPEQLEEVPMARIVKFAERRAVERQDFRAAVEGILDSARSYSDTNAMADYLASNQKRIERAVKNLEQTIDELHVGAISGTAKITVPTGVAAAIATLPVSHVAAGILAGIGLAIGVVSCYAETRGKLRQAKAATPYHYLVAIENDLGVECLIPHKKRKIETK